MSNVPDSSAPTASTAPTSPNAAGGALRRTPLYALHRDALGPRRAGSNIRIPLPLPTTSPRNPDAANSPGRALAQLGIADPGDDAAHRVLATPRTSISRSVDRASIPGSRMR